MQTIFMENLCKLKTLQAGFCFESKFHIILPFRVILERSCKFF